ncbi:uncharacterized protein LOC116654571 [Drosophila ananassae]|uniref:uncharacterized protein LOC116654571 n=1 Tax=Drosophila ananassae TaxID=7217 RepID=UPI001D00060C|nr:uncharacterized protein LOC116654571 [Drosophila ananassae]
MIHKITSLTTFQNMEFSEKFLEWVESHSSTYKNGISVMGSNIRFFLNKEEPLFLIFDEFHLKDIDNAPSRYAKWKVFCVGISNLKGHFQIIYLKTMTSGHEQIGSLAIKVGVKNATDLIKANGVLYSRLEGAADKCASNGDAINFLKSQGLPVIYDLRHLVDKLNSMGHVDVILRHLLQQFLSKSTYMDKIKSIKTVVERTVPQKLQARYENELSAIQYFLRNIFQTFPERMVTLQSVNSDLFESMGSSIQGTPYDAASEAFQKFKELENVEEAIIFMATLTTVVIQKQHKNLVDVYNLLEDQGPNDRGEKRHHGNAGLDGPSKKRA